MHVKVRASLLCPSAKWPRYAPAVLPPMPTVG